MPVTEFSRGYRIVAISTKDIVTFSPATTSHDYSGSLDSLTELVPYGGTCTEPR